MLWKEWMVVIPPMFLDLETYFITTTVTTTVNKENVRRRTSQSKKY
jgi:hypothetical protein